METVPPVQISSPSGDHRSSGNNADGDAEDSSSNAMAASHTPPHALAPRKARQTGFCILPLRHPSSVSTRLILRPTVSQLENHPQSSTGCVSPVDPQDLISEVNPLEMPASVLPTTRDQPPTSPKPPAKTAMAPANNREPAQRPRDRGRTPRKAHRANFQVQRSSADPTQSHPDPVPRTPPDQPEPDATTTANTSLHPNALPPPVPHAERSASQSAAALRDIFERMRQSRERGAAHVARLPIAHWRTDRAGRAVEVAPPVLQMQSIVTESVTSMAAPAPSVPADGISELAAAFSATTPPSAAWVRQGDRLYRERGTPRKARNAPFTIKPLGSVSVNPTLRTMRSSKLGKTGNREVAEGDGGC